MRTWEYTFIKADGDIDKIDAVVESNFGNEIDKKERPPLHSTLKHFGQVGWELVTVYEGGIFVFKRSDECDCPCKCGAD